jgi:hypothetical protein
MAAVQTNTYISQQITSFRSAVQRLRDSTLLKIGEGNVESTIANNLPQVRSEISAIVNAHEDAFPNIAALWRDATPLPDLTAHPHPGEMAPTAQQQRDIDVYDKLHERELIEREMHRLLVDGLYTLARPTYHHRMEIDQPAVGGLVDRGINGQDLSTAWALLRGTVGNPRSANLNVLENRMKTEKQPTGLPLVEWLAVFLEKLSHLRRLGRIYEGRACEAVDYFIATITAPIYGEFIRQFLSEYYDDETRTMANLSSYVGQRAWTYEQGIGMARRGGLGAIDNDEDDTTTGAATANAIAKTPPKQGGLPNQAITTTLDLSLFNKKTLKDLGLKLVSVNDHDRVDKAKIKPKATTGAAGVNYGYCWSHGSFHVGHPGYHLGHECQNPKDGHREDATERNKMGGKTRIYKLI